MRSALGGVLMGLANLVPGISGGTMLLAAGIYPRFISAIAEVTTLRLRLSAIVVLGGVAGSAAVAILALAGPTRDLVIHQRFAMYSLFIGLTLGGVPLVLRLLRPVTAQAVVGAAVGFAVMVWMALAPGAGSGESGPATSMLFLSGLAGAAAMILPGVSGGYLLLLLGQYLPILGAIDGLKQALLASDGPAWDAALAAVFVLVPVGLGVVTGIVGISNLLSRALERFPKPTLGLLLGLLLGAFVGLWPFQQGVPPEAGDLHRGQPLSAAEAAELPAEDWPVERFAPSPGQVGLALVLVLAGLGATLLIDRIGSGGRTDTQTG